MKPDRKEAHWAFGWRRWLGQSSFVVRLVLAQLTLLSLLWLLIVVLIASSENEDTVVLDRSGRTLVWLQIAQALGEDEGQLRNLMARIDAYQRTEDIDVDDEAVRVSMVLRYQGRVLYVSPGKPGALSAGTDGEAQLVEHEGRNWRTLTRHLNGYSLTLIQAKESWRQVFSPSGRAVLLLPLLISLPLLILPTWLAVRLAVRPVQRLGEELLRRPADQFEPLQVQGLPKELAPLRRAINAWMARLAAGRRRERDFVENAAHELRTPLAALSTHLEVLQRAAVIGPEGTATLNGLDRAARRASQLVKQLMSLTRIESVDEGTRQPVDLRRLCEDKLVDLVPLAERRGVGLELDCGEDLELLGFPESLESIIENLVTNALRHSPAGGSVRIALRRLAGPGESTCLRLRVEDQGPGIPAASRTRMLERFQRGPQSGEGAGLGLSIVQAAVQLHHGSLRLEEAPGGGLRVDADFPVASPQP
ncbi:two-component system sensor histidine kinase QseC [Inhella inkyongensis]|uniref:histidine kinase n=1 Tax=Inhella inkyongensis TaxID=392593 RepID=A0A840S2P2_9BURK|nr:HAMP domain-containing sensor histidine kinase [Inhella inkyongensis]MBB5205467.1 two-component system sensor histidine kinase QseC [Inhella inkyongensis]